MQNARGVPPTDSAYQTLEPTFSLLYRKPECTDHIACGACFSCVTLLYLIVLFVLFLVLTVISVVTVMFGDICTGPDASIAGIIGGALGGGDAGGAATTAAATTTSAGGLAMPVVGPALMTYVLRVRALLFSCFTVRALALRYNLFLLALSDDYHLLYFFLGMDDPIMQHDKRWTRNRMCNQT